MAIPPGGKADYVLIGSPRGDTLYGDRYRPNFIFGGQGDDYAYGGSGQDTIYGASGNDRLHGYGGNDWLMGDEGSDILNGGLGNDHLFGGAGNDFLEGDSGNDTLSGGTGSDTFYYFSLNEGHDVITDFNVKQDKILLDGFGFANVKAGSIQVGSDVLIRTSDEGSILLQHVKLNQLTDDMFI